MLIGGAADAAPWSSPSAFSADVNDKATSTRLIVAPNSFPQGLPVTLVAIVTPRAAAGTVQFKDGDNNIGDPVAVYPSNTTIGGQVDTNSSAAFTLTWSLGIGVHSMTAVFSPTDTSAYDSSTSSPQPLTVTPPIFSGLQLPLQSILSSVLGGLAGNTVGIGPVSPLQSLLGGLHS